jgi:cation diffusion facilitator family transporter
MTVYSWNIASDVFSSFCALVGIAGARLGIPQMDPIAAFILSIMVIRAGFIGFHRAYDELMDGAPSDLVIADIRKIAFRNKSVRSITDVKARKMGLEIVIDMTITVDKNMSVEDGHNVTDQIRNEIISSMPTAKDVFIHVEPFNPKRKTTDA